MIKQATWIMIFEKQHFLTCTMCLELHCEHMHQGHKVPANLQRELHITADAPGLPGLPESFSYHISCSMTSGVCILLLASTISGLHAHKEVCTRLLLARWILLGADTIEQC